MIKLTLPFKETGLFDPLVMTYCQAKVEVESFFGYSPTPDNFIVQARNKCSAFPLENRVLLHQALYQQYQKLPTHSKVMQHIDRLQEPNTLTVTTGHQLNLFTGPLYTLYKIISVLNLTEQLNATSDEFYFVPVFWMATEDHDFQEVNHFHYADRILTWNTDQSGGVGRFSLEGLQMLYHSFCALLPESRKKDSLSTLFHDAYLSGQATNWADATRLLFHTLFADYGLVILDADTPILKKSFIPFIQNDIFRHDAFVHVHRTSDELLEAGYKSQVHAREINFFYLRDHIRSRIISEDDKFLVLDSPWSFSKDELIDEMTTHPERFSPNVIMRPLYQETLLPNVAYIGGGGEIAYWLQLKRFFDSQKVLFPILKLRNSVLWLSRKSYENALKNELGIRDLFRSVDSNLTHIVRKKSDIEWTFDQYNTQWDETFDKLTAIANQTEKSFTHAIAAHKQKIQRSITELEKRLLRAEKRKFDTQRRQLTAIHQEVFPQSTLQERYYNFSELVMKSQLDLIKTLKEMIDPIHDEFIVLIDTNEK